MSRPGYDHDEWEALAVGWALSALDAEDGERFADHLPGCDRCTATVREALHTVADLAYATPDEAPPPALKSRLMAAVAAEPRSVPVPLDEEWPLGAPHPGTPGYEAEWTDHAPAPQRLDGPVPGHQRPGDGTAATHQRPGDGTAATHQRLGDEMAASHQRPGDAATHRRPVDGWTPALAPPTGSATRRGRHAADDDDVVVPFESRRRPARRFTVAAAAAAVLALLVGLGAWNLDLRSDRDRLQQVVAQREAAISQLTANGPATVAALAPFGKPRDPRQATLVVRGDQVEIIVEGLPETSGEQRYWLWTLRCDTPTPTDLRPIRGFQVTQSEFSVRSIGSDPGLATAPCFAISREVGTATPTDPREVVLAGQPG